jgi:hypothetical protein
MRMTVTAKWPECKRFDGSIAPAHDVPCTYEQSGWTSVAEMQKELIRRFPHEERFRIPNGVQTKPLTYGIVYQITLHD